MYLICILLRQVDLTPRWFVTTNTQPQVASVPRVPRGGGEEGRPLFGRLAEEATAAAAAAAAETRERDETERQACSVA